jgi:hypothetical protein
VILNNWLRRYRAGAALCRFCPRSWNRIANVLESIEGVGCRIEKTENGWGWQIIVDGNSDGGTPPAGFGSPFAVAPYSASGVEVTVKGFVFYRGGVPIEVTGDTIEVTADGDWIAVEYDPEAETATLILWPASAGLPRDHDGLVVRGIWEFDIEGSEGAEKAVQKREGRGTLGMMAEDGT